MKKFFIIIFFGRLVDFTNVVENYFLHHFYGAYVVERIIEPIKMAIPFNLPSDDTTIEQYRSIHQLLMDLTAILRSLLARNPHWVHADHPNSPSEYNF